MVKKFKNTKTSAKNYLTKGQYKKATAEYRDLLNNAMTPANN